MGRDGISLRSSEFGAARLFPCYLMTPHAFDTPKPLEAKSLGRGMVRNVGDTSISSTTSPCIVIPPQEDTIERSYPWIVPSSSANSTASGPLSLDNSSNPSPPATPKGPSFRTDPILTPKTRVNLTSSAESLKRGSGIIAHLSRLQDSLEHSLCNAEESWNADLQKLQ